MSFKAFLLLLIIGLCAVFVYIKSQSLGPDDSLFNRTTRITLGKHPVLRSLFNLHKDGDARAEYFSGSKNIILEVVQAPGAVLSDKVINEFSVKIHDITGRGVDIYNLDTIDNKTLTDEDIKQIAEVKRKHANLGQPNLFVIYAGDFESKTDEIGKTYQEYGIVLSSNRLRSASGGNIDALEEYQLSTLMHEFGHQLGLEHNDRPDCIMYKDLEIQGAAIGLGGAYATTEYCALELGQLEKIREAVK